MKYASNVIVIILLSGIAFAGSLEIQLAQPQTAITFDVRQNATFVLVATATCVGTPCGFVDATALFNHSTPLPTAIINYTESEKPFFINASRTEDFRNANSPSTGHIAKTFDGSQPPLDSGTELDNTNYARINNSDDINSNFTSTAGNAAGHVFIFSVPERNSTISSIYFSWEGHGLITITPAVAAPVTLFAWNFTSAQWVQIVQASSTSDVMLNASLQPFSFLNATGHSAFLVETDSLIATTRTIKTDYVHAKFVKNSTLGCAYLGAGDSCSVNWTVNASGLIRTRRLVGLQFSGDEVNTSANATVLITGNSNPFLEVRLGAPSPELLANIIQNTTFVVNATVYCRAGTCGFVNATLRFNYTDAEPLTPINTSQGDVPFFINETSPSSTKNCQGNPLDEDEYCLVEWVVNASGDIGTRNKMGVQLRSLIGDNTTFNSSVRIVGCSLDFRLHWSSINFGALLPDSYGNEAPGNADNIYNTSVEEGSCNLDFYIKGTNLTNSSTSYIIETGNISWSNSSNSYPGSFRLSPAYNSIIMNAQPGLNVTTWYWIDAPSVLSTLYNGTIMITGVRNGDSP